MSDTLTGQTVELLQQMIRNRCVNDGTLLSGQETRNSDYLLEEGAAIRVVQPVALAVAPAPLEVAAQDGRQVAGARGQIGRSGRVGVHAAEYRVAVPARRRVVRPAAGAPSVILAAGMEGS